MAPAVISKSRAVLREEQLRNMYHSSRNGLESVGPLPFCEEAKHDGVGGNIILEFSRGFA
jgi:hypothetical protein